MGGQLLCRRVDLSRGVRPELVVVCGRHSRTAPGIETRLATAVVRYQLQAAEGTSSTARKTLHPLRQTSLVVLGRGSHSLNVPTRIQADAFLLNDSATQVGGLRAL